MKCKNCGYEFDEDIGFCPNCGTPVNPSEKYSVLSETEETDLYIGSRVSIGNIVFNVPAGFIENSKTSNKDKRFTDYKEDIIRVKAQRKSGSIMNPVYADKLCSQICTDNKLFLQTKYAVTTLPKGIRTICFKAERNRGSQNIKVSVYVFDYGDDCYYLLFGSSADPEAMAKIFKKTISYKSNSNKTKSDNKTVKPVSSYNDYTDSSTSYKTTNNNMSYNSTNNSTPDNNGGTPDAGGCGCLIAIVFAIMFMLTMCGAFGPIDSDNDGYTDDFEERNPGTLDKNEYNWNDPNADLNP